MGSIHPATPRRAAVALVLAAAAGVVVGVPSWSARAGEYQWTGVPPVGSTEAPSYTDPANWTPTGVPGAGDTAVFALGTEGWLDLELDQSVTHQQLKVIDNFIGLALADGPTD